MVKPRPKDKALKRKTYRNYEQSDIVSAAKKVKAGEVTVYKASKDSGVPYNTLKDFLAKNDDLNHAHVLKMGRPFIPAHSSHLFQPLDVGVYKSLKSVWAKLLNNHMLLNPNNMPSHFNFHELFTPAFMESFTPLNIINSFKKAGACPYNPNVVPAEALAPSRLTDRYGPSSPATPVRRSSLPCGLGQTPPTLSPREPSEEQLKSVEDLLEVPRAPKQTTDEVGNVATSGVIKRKKKPQRVPRDSSAKCLNPPEKDKVDQPKPGTSKDKPCYSDDDWKCGICLKLFSEDVKKKNGAEWLQCSFCKFPYHEKCQKNPTKELIYMCDACEPFYGSQDSD